MMSTGRGWACRSLLFAFCGLDYFDLNTLHVDEHHAGTEMLEPFRSRLSLVMGQLRLRVHRIM
ncbi:hypothetical protein ABIB82_005265 [Bradyrhizobium sp. i1.8.4]